MTAWTRILVALTATAVVGCGASQTSDSMASGSEGSGHASCSGFGLSEPDLLSQCEATEAECPGQVMMAETDPPQFNCPPGPDAPTSSDPDESVSPPDEPTAAESCEGYSLGDSCIDETNFAQCQEMAAACPGQVQVMESCPLQFACPE